MSDPTNTNHRTPLSSSAWGPSGTSALSVTVEPHAPKLQQTSQAADPAPADPVVAEAPLAEAESPEAPPAPVHEMIVPADEMMSAPLDAPQATPDVEAIPLSRTDEHSGEAISAPEVVEPITYEAFSPAGEMATEAANVVHDAVVDAIAINEDAQDQMATIFDQVSQSFKAAISDAGSDAARIAFTLLEFVQANARSNFQLAQDYAGARSVPEIVNVQAAYFKRQMELMNQQARELRKVAAEITSKKAAQMQPQISRQ